MKIDIWKLRLPLSSITLDRLRNNLNQEERGRLKLFKITALAQEFIASRGGLREILSHYTNNHPKNIDICYSKYKKPYLNNSNLNFNVSHSGNYIVYAFCESARIGIDIEKIKSDIDFLDIAKNYFTRNEYIEISKNKGAAMAITFYRCWTRKEACIKAIGQGLYYDLNKIEVTCALNAEPKVLKFEDQFDDNSEWSLIEFTPDEDYIASIAIDRSIYDISIRDWALND